MTVYGTVNHRNGKQFKLAINWMSSTGSGAIMETADIASITIYVDGEVLINYMIDVFGDGTVLGKMQEAWKYLTYRLDELFPTSGPVVDPTAFGPQVDAIARRWSIAAQGDGVQLYVKA